MGEAVMLGDGKAACWEPESLRPGNAEANAAMLHINVALGFKPWSSGKDWTATWLAYAAGMRRTAFLMALALSTQAAADWTGPGFLKDLTPCSQIILMADKDSRDFLQESGLNSIRASVLTGAREVARVTGKPLSEAAVVTSMRGSVNCAPVIVDLDLTPENDEGLRAFVVTTNTFRTTPQTRSIAWQKLSFGALSDVPELAARMIAQRVESHLRTLAQSWQQDR